MECGGVGGSAVDGAERARCCCGDRDEAVRVDDDDVRRAADDKAGAASEKDRGGGERQKSPCRPEGVTQSKAPGTMAGGMAYCVIRRGGQDTVEDGGYGTSTISTLGHGALPKPLWLTVCGFPVAQQWR